MTNMPQPIRIEMPMNFTFKSVNAYLFVEPEPVLVDCGLLLDSSRSALVAGLAAEGLELGDIRQIYLTHPHIDHMGQAADLAAETQAEIWVSDIAADLVANFGERGPAFTAFLDRLMTRFGFPHAAQTSVTEMTKMFWALRKDVPLNALHTFDFEAQLSFGGQEWQVIYAPGHMNRQVLLFCSGQRTMSGCRYAAAKSTRAGD